MTLRGGCSRPVVPRHAVGGPPGVSDGPPDEGRRCQLSAVGGTIGDVLFFDVVNASAAVAATRSRLAKVDALAGVLRAAEPDVEVPAVVGFLVGQPRQGRIGTGWRTLVKLAVPSAHEPTLTVADVDTALTELSTLSGAGSSARRASLLTGLLSRASKAEQEFLIRLLAGELRRGALEGVMVDAVARA